MKKRNGSNRLLAPLLGSVAILFAAPAMADPIIGLGLSFSFGGGKVDTGVGVRLFSDNRADSFAGSVGVDYMFGSKSFRGTVGGAYLSGDTYLGLDLGIDLKDGGFEFGLGAGGLIGEDLDDGGDQEDTPENTNEDTFGEDTSEDTV